MKRGVKYSTVCLITVLTGCVPRIEVAAPEQPITINMNVKVDHEITIKADKPVAALLSRSGES